MTWTAPEFERRQMPRAAGERDALEEWLDFHRETLLWKCAGLTEDQLRLRSVAPSTMSLLGLVRHMAEVERGWFRISVAGEPEVYLYGSEDSLDADFDDVDTADAEADFEVFEREVAAARAAVSGRSLDDTFLSRRGKTLDLRWVYLHMIEEYARHNGHADLLREAIDGTTGA
jgi:uncharacterized damage-inducible protein DinB